MALIGFTKFYYDLLDGSKRQTIRLPRKHPIQLGETLHLYWKLRTKSCRKIGEARCITIIRLPWSLFKNDDVVARKDGFKDSREMRRWFQRTHRPTDSTLFDIVRWEAMS